MAIKLSGASRLIQDVALGSTDPSALCDGLWRMPAVGQGTATDSVNPGTRNQRFRSVARATRGTQETRYASHDSSDRPNGNHRETEQQDDRQRGQEIKRQNNLDHFGQSVEAPAVLVGLVQSREEVRPVSGLAHVCSLVRPLRVLIGWAEKRPLLGVDLDLKLTKRFKSEQKPLHNSRREVEFPKSPNDSLSYSVYKFFTKNGSRPPSFPHNSKKPCLMLWMVFSRRHEKSLGCLQSSRNGWFSLFLLTLGRTCIRMCS